MDEIQAQLGCSRQTMAKRLIGLVELDEHCRQILSRIEPPSGAADRLAQIVSDIEPYVKTQDSQKRRTPSRVATNALTFDVFGAQYIPKKHKDKSHRDEQHAKGASRVPKG